VSGTTWTKFYWSDWESDPALRLCSLAAQGLWMGMLCIASAHDPIGYVAVAGRGLDETALARMTGCPESEVADLLGELDRNGVFSRDRTGRIYSRRMVSDAKKASIARKNGKQGGNPSLTKQRGNPSSDNPPDKTPLKTQKPEARSQIYSEDKSSDAIRVVVDHSAEAWTRAVRLLTERGMSPDKARSLFGRLLRDNRLEARDMLPALVKAEVSATQDPVAYLTKSAQGVSRRASEPVKPKRVGWV
jgi:hypothetical protein